MGLVAIHTPSYFAVARQWGGLCKNFKFFRFASCDVTMACASMLPADPLQIGTEAGDIAPQDMFNPILYKAVSNDSYNNIVNRIMVYSSYSDVANNSESVVSVNAPDFGALGSGPDEKPFTQFDLYYALLADKDGWKKSMPQSGLQMKGLYPIVFSVMNTVGNAAGYPTWKQTPGQNEDPNTVWTQPALTDGTGFQGTDIGRYIRGPSMRMPRLPTLLMNNQAIDDPSDATLGAMPEVPPCYVAALVLPPAKLNKLYYRLKVTWTIEFSEPRSLIEVLGFPAMAQIGHSYYGTDYVEQSGVATEKTNMVDAMDANVTKVMEGT
uniref:Capsid protein n=1 Tax=Cressdnaviricota sp. TaxID=2748378 RepID=A0A4D6IWK2_9VIRU|nr:capsid protein [Cressdnaviricota sp.]